MNIPSGVEAVVPAPGHGFDTEIELRKGVASEAEDIHLLILANLEVGHLLPRTLSELTVYAHRFTVANREGRIVACAELAPLSRTVAEIRSLVVEDGKRGSGLGRLIVTDLRRRARHEGFETLCAFTHNPAYFVRLGFSIVPHFWLPEKISTDCWRCPLFQRCGQYAMVDHLGSPARPLPPQPHATTQPCVVGAPERAGTRASGTPAPV